MFMEWFRNKYPYTDFHELNFDIFITEFKSFVEALSKLDSWVDKHEEEYQELKDIVDDIYNGTLTPALDKSLRIWINKNIDSIIADAVKMVFFGITDNGYFVAYIPDSWSDIAFGTTGLDDFPAGVEFGHLTLSY